jgi:hypothetical protein
MRSVINIGVLILLVAQMVLALDMTRFRECISANGPALGYGSDCTLDPGAYTIYQELRIERGFINIYGTVISSREDTTLIRGVGYTNPIFVANSPSQLTRVRINSLTINGNRYSQSLPSGQFAADVQFNNCNRCALFDVFLKDSPKIAVAIDSSATYFTFSSSRVSRAREMGIWTNGLGSQFNMRVSNSTFDLVGANAIFFVGQQLEIYWCIFSNNHSEFPYNIAGGQIFLDRMSSGILVDYNTIQGAATSGHWAAGVEAYGNNINILGNKISGHSGHGVYLTGSQNVNIGPNSWGDRNEIRNNGLFGPYFAGILITNNPVGYGYGNAANISVVNSSSTGHTSGFGVRVEAGGAPISNLSLQNNCLAGNSNAISIASGALGSGYVNTGNSSSCY